MAPLHIDNWTMVLVKMTFRVAVAGQRSIVPLLPDLLPFGIFSKNIFKHDRRHTFSIFALVRPSFGGILEAQLREAATEKGHTCAHTRTKGRLEHKQTPDRVEEELARTLQELFAKT